MKGSERHSLDIVDLYDMFYAYILYTCINIMYTTFKTTAYQSKNICFRPKTLTEMDCFVQTLVFMLKKQKYSELIHPIDDNAKMVCHSLLLFANKC